MLEDGAVAFMRLNIAATAGHENALKDRNRAHKHLSSEQIAEGRGSPGNA